jgi:hypothetical protein
VRSDVHVMFDEVTSIIVDSIEFACECVTTPALSKCTTTVVVFITYDSKGSKISIRIISTNDVK